MLSVTHIGHSGWVVEADNCTILIDPLLTDAFGRGPHNAKMPQVWPPRTFSLARFPTLDAVLISHEHEDHFNIPSLHLLQRDIAIYISSRSSTAAKTVLSEMGFRVFPLVPGHKVNLGSLEILPLSPDHITHFNSDEWDGLGLCLRDVVHGGTFFTNVDIAITENMIQRVSAGTCNTDAVLVYTKERLFWTQFETLNKVPSVTVAGAAWSLQGIDVLKRGDPITIAPGYCASVSKSEIVWFNETVPFVTLPPSSEWGAQPSWRYHPRQSSFGPACGRFELSDADLEELDAGLSALAEFIYGTELFKSLLSLTLDPGLSYNSTFLLLLVADQQHNHFAFAYNAMECSFEEAETSNPFEEYVCGVECWATDLACAFRGEFEPRILSLGRSRMWARHRSIPDPFVHVLWPFFHPLRRPIQCLNGYREQLKTLGEPQGVIARRGS